MKRALVFLFGFLLVMLISQTSSAKIKKVPTGTIEKDTYADARFGFRISTIENWKIGDEEETDKKPSLIRATLHQVNYQVRRGSRFAASETARPTIVITADTSSLSVEDFEKTLLAGKANSQAKVRNDYFLKLDMLSNSEFVSSNEIDIDSVKGKRIIVKKTYSKQVGDETAGSGYASDNTGSSGSSSSTPSSQLDISKTASKVSIVEDYIVGVVLLFKKGDVVYAIQFSCEREFVKLANEDFTKIMTSWKF